VPALVRVAVAVDVQTGAAHEDCCTHAPTAWNAEKQAALLVMDVVRQAVSQAVAVASQGQALMQVK
jgi:hypothetical protein